MNLVAPGISIRRLTPLDLPAMEAMNTMFGEAFDEVDVYTTKRPGAAYLKRLLDSPRFIALAAMNNGEVVGGLAAYQLQKFEQERSEIYIYDLAVEVSHRRKGIATALIEQLKILAESRGVQAIYVQADRVDLPAIALYSKLGVASDVLHFDIGFGPDAKSGIDP